MPDTPTILAALDVAIEAVHSWDGGDGTVFVDKPDGEIERIIATLRSLRSRIEKEWEFHEAAMRHGWYEWAFAAAADGMGLQECQEADAAKQAFVDAFRTMHISEKPPEEGET